MDTFSQKCKHGVYNPHGTGEYCSICKPLDGSFDSKLFGSFTPRTSGCDVSKYGPVLGVGVFLAITPVYWHKSGALRPLGESAVDWRAE